MEDIVINLKDTPASEAMDRLSASIQAQAPTGAVVLTPEDAILLGKLATSAVDLHAILSLRDDIDAQGAAIMHECKGKPSTDQVEKLLKLKATVAGIRIARREIRKFLASVVNGIKTEAKG